MSALATRRAAAEQKLSTLELPTKKTPGWEFTELKGLELNGYALPEHTDAGALDRAEPIFKQGGNTVRFSQVDGEIVHAGTDLPEADADGLPTAPVVCSIEVAAERFPKLIERELGSIVDRDELFVTRNDASWRGGLLVYVPKGQTLESPVISSVLIHNAKELGWRVLIVLEENSEAEVWEQSLTTGEGVSAILNTVYEIRVGESARLRLVSGQQLSEKSWVFGTQRAIVERNGSLDWVTLGFGSGGGRVRLETRLAGKGADARVTGAYASRNSQHIDYDTIQEHGATNTTSDLAFRGILDDRSTSVWRGMIRVEPGAQSTDAFQESRNLLLTRKAHADAIPGLEIEADDVRCTHAAAIAQIDPEQLFYLHSRGLGDDDARKLIVEGFLSALVERFSNDNVREAIAGALERRVELLLG